jgi:glycosyltransferase involved in cell wall biosynthesis
VKLLVLSTWFPCPPDNGSKLRAFYLLRAMECSHQVTLVAFRPAHDSTNGLFPAPTLGGIRVYPVPADPYRYVNVPRVLKFTSPIPVVFYPNGLMQQTVAQIAGLCQWDAVVAFQTPAALYALRLPGVPSVLDVDTALSYNMYARYTSQNSSLARLRTWVSWQKAHQYETCLFRKFQACTVVSPTELDHVAAMVSAANCRVEVVPNGVDCQHNRPGLVQLVPNTLVFNGSLTYSANYEAMRFFLAEIYPLIRHQVPGVAVTITGSISDVNLPGLRLDENVRFSGYVEDVRPLVAGAWACVVPICQGGGTRLKILEAMALGTPVVATSKGAEGLDVVDGEHILLADDPGSFASRALQLLNDPELRQRLAANARRLVEQRYDWAQIGQQFVALVEQVASHHKIEGSLA